MALALFAVILAMLLAQPTDRQAGAQPAPDIATVAVDLDPIGNTATNIGAGGPGIDPGDIQSSAGNIAIDSTLTFDIVVDAVPSGAIFGIGLDVNYDQTIVEVTAVNRFSGLLQYSSGMPSPFGGNDTTPDIDGSFRVDAIDLGGTNETGPGKVLDVTVKCVGTGTTPITLTDTSTGGGDNAGILSPLGFAYTIGTELEGLIGGTRLSADSYLI